MSDIITIHQFSTGINIEIASDRTWISKGFTGTWMNVTSTVVPPSIEKAIGELKFKGDSSDNPAFIGRVIEGNKDNGEPDFYSVLAVIDKGLDESRGFSVYRYFWCKEKDSLYLILGWLLEQKKQEGKIPTFDPLEENTSSIILYKQKIEEYQKKASLLDKLIEENKNNKYTGLFSAEIPQVIRPEEYHLESLLLFDRLATKIATDKKLLTSWAFRVQNLNNIEGFIIIHTASSEAYTIITGLIPPPPPPPESPLKAQLLSIVEKLEDTDIRKIKDALVDIESLLKYLKFTYDSEVQELKNKHLRKEVSGNIKFLLKNLKDTHDSDLDKIFDDLGSTEAINQENYEHGKIELVTLRAIFLPQTLADDYVYNTINIQPKTNDNISKLLSFLQPSSPQKQYSIKEESKTLQEKLRTAIVDQDLKLYPQLIENLQEGISFPIKKLLNGKKLRFKDAFIWLLTAEQSFWKICPKEKYLKPVYTITRNDADVQKTHQLQTPITNRNKPELIHFKDVADVFAKLEEYELAYYYYRRSNTPNTKIDPKIIISLNEPKFKKVFDCYDVPIIKDDDDSIIIDAINSFLYIIFLIIIWRIKSSNLILVLIVLSIAIFYLGLYLYKISIRKKIKQHSLPIMMFFVMVSIIFIQPNNMPEKSSLSQVLEEIAITSTQRGKTRDAIQKIKANILADNEFTKKHLMKGKDVQPEKITKALYSVLKVQFQTEQNDQLPNVIKIAEYEQKKQLPPTGIIELVDVEKNPDSLMKKLQIDVRQKIEFMTFKERTRKAIQTIQNNIIKERSKNPTTGQQVIKVLEQVLTLPDGKYSQLINNPDDYQLLQELTEKIKVYQKAKNPDLYSEQINPDGIIDVTGTTINNLQKDIKQKLPKLPIKSQSGGSSRRRSN